MSGNLGALRTDTLHTNHPSCIKHNTYITHHNAHYTPQCALRTTLHTAHCTLYTTLHTPHDTNDMLNTPQYTTHYAHYYTLHTTLHTTVRYTHDTTTLHYKMTQYQYDNYWLLSGVTTIHRQCNIQHMGQYIMHTTISDATHYTLRYTLHYTLRYTRHTTHHTLHTTHTTHYTLHTTHALHTLQIRRYTLDTTHYAVHCARHTTHSILHMTLQTAHYHNTTLRSPRTQHAIILQHNTTPLRL